MGTLFNIVTVIIGSAIGLLFRSRLPERFIKIVFTAMGLFTIYLGLSMALKANEILLLVFALVLGGLFGEWMRLDQLINRFSNWIKSKVNIADEKFSEGMTTAFMLFCVGSLTILGAFEEGTGNPPNLLITKGVMDGFSSIALSAALGPGVLFSAIPLGIFQGGLTLFAGILQPFLSDPIINEITATGGVMIIGIGINILEIKELNVINLLPALLISPFLVSLFA